MKSISKIIIALLVISFYAMPVLAQENTKEKTNFSELKGPYLGQKPPGSIPEIFAPGIISETGAMVHDTPIFFSEGTELYWPKAYSNRYASILYSKMIGNKWAEPKPVSFTSPDEIDGCPFLSPDGKMLFFNSFRDLKKGVKSRRERIWYVKKEDNDWGEPQAAGHEINSLPIHWQTSFSLKNNLYVTTDNGLMRSTFEKGKFTKAVKVVEVLHPDYVGGNAYISPDESYIIFTSDKIPGGFGNDDLYIGYKKNDGSWTDPINIGEKINTKSYDLCPVITPDGKYLFFLSRRNDRPGVYWVETKFIEELKPDYLK